jgi:transcription initiation factor TFIIB
MISDDEEIMDIQDDNLWELYDNMFITDTPEKNSEKCLNCQSLNIVNEQSKGCLVCIDCGTVKTQTFSQNAEWSNYEDGKTEGTMRCGSITNFFLPKSSLGTTISGKGFSVLKMLQNWNQMPYKERSLSDTLQYIEHICKKANILKCVIDNAKILYKQISEQKYNTKDDKIKNVIIRGNNRKGIMSACLYYGSKLQGFPISIKEIGELFEIKIKSVTKGCRKFMELMKANTLIKTMLSITPKDYIERFCNKLKLNKEQIEKIYKIAINVTQLNLASNHQPTSISAGSIMIFAHLYKMNIQKKMISELFEISIVTIDKIFKKIFPFRKVIISDELTKFVKKKLMDANYIMVQEEREIINNELIEISESDIILDNEPVKKEIIKEKKKRGRKKKIIAPVITDTIITEAII